MDTIQRSVRHVYRRLSSAGIDADTNFYEASRIRYSNFLALLTAVGVAVYAPISLYLGERELALLQILLAAAVWPVWLWNQRSQYNRASLYLLVVANLMVLSNAWFIGPAAAVQFFFVLVNVTPFLLFSYRQKGFILLGSAISVSSCLIYYAFRSYFYPFQLPIHQQELLFRVNLITDFLLFGGGIFLLARSRYQVEERLQISNRQLLQQQKRLEESNQHLEQFAFVFSHDIKTPLRNIDSFLMLLSKKSRQLEPESLQFIEHAREASGRMTRIVDDLLSYSRLHQSLPAAADLNLEKLCQSIVREFPQEKADVQIGSSLPVLKSVHDSLIYRVLMNLIGNGIKFNRRFPKIRIEAESDGQWHHIRVYDNGIGIPPSEQRNLFRMYQRGSSANEFQGTGMGLAISRKILLHYGGDIRLESSSEEGSCFCLSFPR